MNWKPEIVHRDISQVWADWHSQPIWPVYQVLAVVSPIVAAGALLMTLLLLPLVVDASSVWRGLSRAVRIVAGGIGLLTLLSTIAGFAIVWLDLNSQYMGYPQSSWVEWARAFIMVLVPSFLLTLVTWLMTAGRGAAVDRSSINTSPRCEDCGYDLTCLAADNVCPECGTSVAVSVGPIRRRQGLALQRGGSWVQTGRDVLRRPFQTYRTLLLDNGDEGGMRFARRHWVMMGVGAWAWLLALNWETSVNSFLPTQVQFFAVPILAGLMTVVCGLVVRGITAAIALVTSYFTGLHELMPRINRLMQYETAFLWVFCGWNGMIITGSAFHLFNRGMPIADLTFAVLRMPPEAVGIIFGNIGLVCLWLLRYRTACRAVRWANY